MNFLNEYYSNLSIILSERFSKDYSKIDKSIAKEYPNSYKTINLKFNQTILLLKENLKLLSEIREKSYELKYQKN